MKGCRPLTDDECALMGKSFGGTFGTRNKALFILGKRTGFRISELLSLTLADVYQYGQILDQVTVRRGNMKGQIEGRTVPIHDEAKAALLAWILEMPQRFKEPLPPTTPLFCSRVRDKATGLRRHISREQGWRVFKEAINANRMQGKTGTHAMRKTFCNRMFKLFKGDLVKTQKSMGHKNINSTVSYLSFREEDIFEAILAA